MQRCKYPTKTMNITQSYTGTYSHSKNYNGSPRDYPIDDNCGTTGRSYFYAPFDCSIKRIYGVGAKGTNTIWIQSQAPVQTPSFTDYVTIMVIHPNDDTLGKLKVGQVFEAAIPIAIIAVGVGNMLGKKNMLGQNVIIQSIGASSGVIVAGAIFTLPAL